MKYLEKVSDYKVEIDKLKSVYFDTIEKIIEWSKDDLICMILMQYV